MGDKLEIATLTGHSSYVHSVAFSPDGNTLASASLDNTVKLWSVSRKRAIATLAGHSDSVYSVAFSPDGNTLASASRDNTVKLWSVGDNLEIATLTGHSDSVYSVAFSPNGNTLASASTDNTVKLWSVRDKREITTLTGHSEWVSSVAFSPDGNTLGSGSTDATVLLWDLSHFSIASESSPLGSAPEPIDTIPPEIVILSPAARGDRGLEVRPTVKQTTVIGRATDASGIYEVIVNGAEARVTGGGKFNAEVLLGYGENTITVTATDTRRNTATQRFTIVRKTAGDVERKGKDYALLFATDRYDHWRDLGNPIHDAKTIGVELEENYGFAVELIKDPTREGLFVKLREYADRQYTDDEQLLIIFTGHGHFDEVFNRGYVVARDSKRDDPALTSYIAHANLREVIDNIPCKHIFLVMDVCFGGTIDPLIAMRGEDDEMYKDVPKQEFIKRKLKFKTRRYLTSGGKEYVPDGRPGRHSPFARKVLEALRNYGGSDGILTLNEILSYVEKVDPRPRAGQFGGNAPGSDFIFIAR